MRIPTLHPGLLLLVCATFLQACSEDPAPVNTSHLFYPSWVDSVTVVAGVEHRGANSGGNLLLRHAYTGEMTSVFVPDLQPQARYWSRTGNPTALAAASNGSFFFFSRSGAILGRNDGGNGVRPSVASFDDTSYVWAGGVSGRLVVGFVVHTGEPWQPVRSTILKDTALSGTVLDIVRTAPLAYAVHLSGGRVHEYTFDGRLLSQFAFTPLRAGDPWKARLFHYTDPLNARLYALGDTGIIAFDLAQKTVRYPVLGRIINFHISVPMRLMVYETVTGDIWLHTVDGTPLARLAPHNIMPSLSPSGRSLAAVGPVPKANDTLTVVHFTR